MKTTMKFFAALTIMLGFSFAMMAQNTNTSNDNIEGKAYVVQAMNVSGLTALDFKNVSPGIPKTIDLKNVATGGNIGGETTGKFTVSAAAGTPVNIKFTTLPSNLVSGGNNLQIGDFIAAYDNAESYTSGNTFTPSTGIDITSFPTNPIGSANGIYVFIGGKVTPTTSQPTGNYAADITLTATYN